MSVFFNGQELVTPTTASVVNDDAMQNQNPSSGNAVAYVGKSLGGQPGVRLTFGTPEEAKAMLRGGEGMDAVVAAFAPSQDTGAPQTVSFYRVNPAVQASGVLKGAGNVAVINLKSRNYGQKDNTIKAKVEAGSLRGNRVTVEQGASYFTGDNIGRAAFSLLYTGTEATATITITGGTVVLNAPAATVLETIDLTDFPTVAELVDKLNSIANFTAEVLDSSDNAPTLNGLDYAAALSVKTKAIVRADLQAVVDWFNGGSQKLVTATRIDGVGIPPAATGYVFLSGGSEGVTTVDEWAAAFELMQRAEIQWITAISGDPAIHAMVDAHLLLCSGHLKRERRAISGTVAGTSDADAIEAARALNSKRSSLVHIGHYQYDSANKLVLRQPYITAALIAAMFAASNPGTAMTNKTFNCRGLERDLLNPTETDPLIKGGVLCVENTDDGYKVVRSITTWLGDSKYNNKEQSTGSALDFTVRNWRQAVDVLRGQKGDPLITKRAITLSEGILNEMARPEPEGPGAIVGDAENPAYRNLSATVEGDVVRIQGEVSPAVSANYILVTVYANVYSGSAASA